MRSYLAVIASSPGGRLPEVVLEAAEAAAVDSIPVPPEHLESGRWVSGDGGVALLSWSNEPRHELLPRPLIERGGRVLGYCGYLGEPEDDERKLFDSDRLGDAAESLGGCFSVFRAGEHEVQAATSIARVCPVYYAEAGGVFVAGSRALLVHLVARAAATNMARPSVDLDTMALQPMVRHGFFTNDETPFAGVRALPAASTITVRPGGRPDIVTAPLPEVLPAPTGARAARERVGRLAEALIKAAAPLARHDEPVNLALSGGRDSRVMASILRAAKVPMTATTHGFADDPDVILGTEIARRLGIEHKVNRTVTAENQTSVDVAHPFLRAYDIIRTCEGMTSAYERVNNWAPYNFTPKTSGSGGETLRGGFLYDQKDQSPAGLRKRVESIFKSGSAFLTPEANARAAELHGEWAERTENDGAGVLDLLYLFYRSGRWIVGSHTATLMNGPYYHPFFDNRVVREALALPATWRANEEVVFRLIETLAPEIADVPPEGKRWRFEANSPRRLREWPAWRRRAAVLPVGRTAGFNWRKSYDENFLAILRDQVLSAPPELFDIVDERRAKEHFASVPKGWANQTWHIYTLAVLLSGEWRDARPDLPDVTIPIP
ncbi:asparagine synthase-related protein [Actinomadura syzygii]|uniref:asparagine synthase-related protein n=1 Tax=Actinomadura syzygii TaxID=1427538 RepID=UPI001CA353F5|nr:asparagine synthase-related protein [Actinomadura syzygii]